jgi:RNA polymerase sigma factor (sigma-70 family)
MVAGRASGVTAPVACGGSRSPHDAGRLCDRPWPAAVSPPLLREFLRRLTRVGPILRAAKLARRRATVDTEVARGRPRRDRRAEPSHRQPTGPKPTAGTDRRRGHAEPGSLPVACPGLLARATRAAEFIGRRCGLRAADMEDLQQEVMLRVLEARGRLPAGERSQEAWLLKTTMRAQAAAHRNEVRRRRAEGGHAEIRRRRDLPTIRAAVAPSVLDRLEVMLTAEEYFVFELVRAGQGVREIARRAGVSSTRVSRRLAMAKDILRITARAVHVGTPAHQ